MTRKRKTEPTKFLSLKPGYKYTLVSPCNEKFIRFREILAERPFVKILKEGGFSDILSGTKISTNWYLGSLNHLYIFIGDVTKLFESMYTRWIKTNLLAVIKGAKWGLFIDSTLHYYIIELTSAKFQQTEKVGFRAKRGYVMGIDGEEIKKDNAVKIRHLWFEKDRNAIEVNNVWYPVHPSAFALDARTKKPNFVEYLENGLIDVKDERPVYGAFSRSNPRVSLKIFVKPNGNHVHIVETLDTKALGLKEHRQDGLFYLVKDEPDLFGEYSSTFTPFNYTKRKIKPPEKCSDPLKKTITEHNQKFGTDSLTNLMSEGKPYSFGVEIETSKGFIPSWLASETLNLKAVRDGSIQGSGAEYVTGVIYGDAGFLMLKKICKHLCERTTTNRSCGVHVHIGNANFNTEFSIWMFLLCKLLEEDIFNMLPFSRRDNPYCTRLDISWISSSDLRALISETANKEIYKNLINKLFQRLFMAMSHVKADKKINRKSAHPGGHYGGGRGGMRYNWLNLINANFVQRSNSVTGTVEELSTANSGTSPTSRLSAGWGIMAEGELIRSSSPSRPSGATTSSNDEHKQCYTVEFRCHSGTTNYIKIRNWILICMGIVAFVENRKHLLIKALRKEITLDLETVLRSTYSKPKADMLVKYIEKRKKLHSKSDVEEPHKEAPPADADKILTTVQETNVCA